MLRYIIGIGLYSERNKLRLFVYEGGKNGSFIQIFKNRILNRLIDSAFMVKSVATHRQLVVI